MRTTCSAVAKSTRTTCQKRALPGSHYCLFHIDRGPLLLAGLVGAVLSLLVSEGYRAFVPSHESQDLGAARVQLAQLSKQLDALVAGNEVLRRQLTPFERMAQERYPGLAQEDALGKLQTDIKVVEKRAAELEKKVEAADPVLQPIRTGTATVEVRVDSDEAINTTFMDRGGYFALARGDKPVLVTSGAQARAVQVGGNRVIWRAVWNMDASDQAIGKPVQSLKEAQYAQIQFLQMPKGSKVLGGSVRLTINSAAQLDFEVPPQQTSDGLILIRSFGAAFGSLERRQH